MLDSEMIDRGDWINLIPPLSFSKARKDIFPGADVILMDWSTFELRIKGKSGSEATECVRILKLIHEACQVTKGSAATSHIVSVDEWYCQVESMLYKGKSRTIVLKEVPETVLKVKGSVQ